MSLLYTVERIITNLIEDSSDTLKIVVCCVSEERLSDED